MNRFTPLFILIMVASWLPGAAGHPDPKSPRI